MQVWTAFLLGFAGSLHCAAMCGPLLVALSKSRRRTLSDSTGRVIYHFARISCYGLLGLILGLVGDLAVPAGFQRWLSITLGLGLLLSLLAASRVSLSMPVTRWVGLLRNFMGTMLQRNSLSAQAALGALNGLLPCGLVYVAAVGAAATGHPASGAIFMIFFGLGTFPMMLGIHIAGQRLAIPPGFPIRSVTRTAVLMMSFLLILRGLGLGIPFLSPKLSNTAGADIHCH